MDADLSTLTWPLFANALRDAFLPHNMAVQYMHGFLNLKQGSQSMDAYALQFRRVLILAGDVSDRVAVAHFTT